MLLFVTTSGFPLESTGNGWKSLEVIHSKVEIPSGADAERIHVITPEEEMEYFRRAVRLTNLHDVCRLMKNQGVRPEEATALAKRDVDFEASTIFISSGKSKAARRTLNMTLETRQIMKRRMEGDSPWIFPSVRKPDWHIGRINSGHDRILAEAAKDGVALDFVPYDFRHTFATLLAQTGIDLSTLAALLGHESTRCVHKYVHPTAEHKKMAMKRYDRQMRRGK